MALGHSLKPRLTFYEENGRQLGKGMCLPVPTTELDVCDRVDSDPQRIAAVICRYVRHENLLVC